jgi:hypothetical protein
MRERELGIITLVEEAEFEDSDASEPEVAASTADEAAEEAAK